MGNVIVGKWPGSGLTPTKIYFVVDVATGERQLPKSYTNAKDAKLAFRNHISRSQWSKYAIVSISSGHTLEWTLGPDGAWEGWTL